MNDAFYLGVDPGQAIDPTRIAIVQRIADPNGGGKPFFHCVHLRRLPLQKALPEAPVLKLELEDFRASVTDTGRWTFGARSARTTTSSWRSRWRYGAPRAALRCISIPACWPAPRCRPGGCAPAITR